MMRGGISSSTASWPDVASDAVAACGRADNHRVAAGTLDLLRAPVVALAELQTLLGCQRVRAAAHPARDRPLLRLARGRLQALVALTLRAHAVALAGELRMADVVRRVLVELPFVPFVRRAQLVHGDADGLELARQARFLVDHVGQYLRVKLHDASIASMARKRALRAAFA